MTLWINKLYSGGLITNYFCTSRCRHCLYNCSPYWSKEYIDENTVHKNLSIIKKLGVNSVHIGGGEPFLRIEQLKTVVKILKSYHIPLEYIETNSSWYKDSKTTYEILEEFYSIGVHTLLISISPFHNEYIPFYKVQGVIKVAQDVGIEIFPWKQDFMPDILKLDTNIPHSFKEFESLFGSDYLNFVESRYWIVPGGRALKTFRPIHKILTIEQLLEVNNYGCQELENISHFHVDLYGKYIPGLCSGLAIDVEDIGKPLDTKKYPIITTLQKEGIKGLYNFSKDYGFSPKMNGYWIKCELCNEIRYFLFDRFKEQFLELSPKGYYLYFR